MRRRFARRSRTARVKDTIWCPFLLPCLGQQISSSCATLATINFNTVLDNVDWQPDAAAVTSFDHAMLLRTILTFTWTYTGENQNAHFVYGLFRVDQNVVAASFVNLWVTGPWGRYDCLWGPAVQSCQSFAHNPITIDIATKRKLSSNEKLVFVLQGDDNFDGGTYQLGGRFLVNRLVR